MPTKDERKAYHDLWASLVLAASAALNASSATRKRTGKRHEGTDAQLATLNRYAAEVRCHLYEMDLSASR